MASATVLIAMDGSEYCDFAFDWYIERIHRETNHVILFNCLEFHTLNAAGSAELAIRKIDEEKAMAELYLRKLTDKMKSASLRGKVRQVHGSPRSEIVSCAEEENVDMIVTGTRGLGAVKRTLLGSVSDHVLHHARVPVLICKHKDDHHHRDRHDSHKADNRERHDSHSEQDSKRERHDSHRERHDSHKEDYDRERLDSHNDGGK